MSIRQIAIIDVGSGNLYSVEKAVHHVAEDDEAVFLCEEASQLTLATHIILPGVGAFADCMKGLMACDGLREMLERRVLEDKVPFLGICVGMQMLFERGHEHGVHEGLGWLKGEVVPLAPNEKRVGSEVSRPSEPSASDLSSEALAKEEASRHVSDSSRDSGRNQNNLKIPHMGWNDLQIEMPHPLLEGVENGDHAYFVHSYHCVPEQPITALSVDYGGKVVAAVAKDNLFATQFHPEKSQKTGLRILKNFIEQPHAR